MDGPSTTWFAVRSDESCSCSGDEDGSAPGSPCHEAPSSRGSSVDGRDSSSGSSRGRGKGRGRGLNCNNGTAEPHPGVEKQQVFSPPGKPGIGDEGVAAEPWDGGSMALWPGGGGDPRGGSRRSAERRTTRGCWGGAVVTSSPDQGQGHQQPQIYASRRSRPATTAAATAGLLETELQPPFPPLTPCKQAPPAGGGVTGHHVGHPRAAEGMVQARFGSSSEGQHHQQQQLQQRIHGDICFFSGGGSELLPALPPSIITPPPTPTSSPMWPGGAVVPDAPATPTLSASSRTNVVSTEADQVCTCWLGGDLAALIACLLPANLLAILTTYSSYLTHLGTISY